MLISKIAGSNSDPQGSFFDNTYLCIKLGQNDESYHKFHSFWSGYPVHVQPAIGGADLRTCMKLFARIRKKLLLMENAIYETLIRACTYIGSAMGCL